jgi:Ni/Co efflux regulator RcnB
MAFELHTQALVAFILISRSTAMVMASAAGQSTNEEIEKSKIDASQQTVDSGMQRDGRRQARRLQQVDLSGFIGGDVWMVGKYER